MCIYKASFIANKLRFGFVNSYCPHGLSSIKLKPKPPGSDLSKSRTNISL